MYHTILIKADATELLAEVMNLLDPEDSAMVTYKGAPFDHYVVELSCGISTQQLSGLITEVSDDVDAIVSNTLTKIILLS